jgi:Ca2+/H+ antiporter, TMEM165/GDT1 family
MAANWARAAPAVLAAFLASFVECVEALTIVLAAGLTRGWISALLGASSGAVVLASLVALLGTKLRLVPFGPLQLGIGVLLLLFGALWLRKAVLRAAGALELHDEAKLFAREARALSGASRGLTSIDALGFITSLKGVFIEGVEVVFIVVAVGAAGGLLRAASLGALFAALAVILLGVALHRPLARVPENLLKFAVGVLLSSFGVFWIGEGAGLYWPADDWSILALVALFVLAALISIRVLKTSFALREGKQ